MADVSAMIEVSAGAAAYREAGAAVQVIQSEDGVDGTRCADLAQTRGIEASAAVRLAAPLRAAGMPASELTVWEVTSGVPALLAQAGGGADASGTRGGPGVWLSKDLADRLGAQRADPLATSEGVTTVAGVYEWPDDGRARTLGYAVLTPVASSGEFDQCWALVWPVDDETTGLLYAVLAPGSSADATIGALNTSLGVDYDTPRLFRERLTRHAPLGAAITGLTLGWVAVRLRRLEIASALHARVPGVAVAWQHLVETVTWATAALVITAAAIAGAAVSGNPDLLADVWLVGMQTAVAGSLSTLLGALAGVGATRESHLFRYFKDR